MASIVPVFESLFLGSGVVNSESWIDIAGIIPTGKQLWIGYASLISNDKTLTFELRPNIPTKSLATIAETQLRGFASVLAGESKDLDLYYYGNITTLAPIAVPSSGVERLWMRITSGSNSAGTYNYIIYYTIY
jgi:hypothetical protein